MAMFGVLVALLGAPCYSSTDGSDFASLLQQWFAPDAVGANSVATSPRKPVLWLHTSKTGGNLMCDLAKMAGERIVQPASDCCNWNIHDDWIYKGDPMTQLALRSRRVDVGVLGHPVVSCDERVAGFMGYTWGQIEREMLPTDLCWEKFGYGVFLREPSQYLTSVITYYTHISANLLHDLQSIQASLETSPASEIRPLLMMALAKGEKLLDNYQVRTLSGDYTTPFGFLTDQHFKEAQSRLANFSYVMKLETIHDDAPTLVAALGWNDSLISEFDKKHRPLPNGTSVIPAWNRNDDVLINISEKMMALLLDINRYDVALYATTDVRAAAIQPA